MRKFARKSRIAAAAVTLAVMGVAGLVYAAWLATGTGSGSAKAKTAQALTTVDVSASTTATLYPGASGDVVIKVSNPNPYPIQVTGVSGNGAVTADSGHSTCGSDAQHPTGVSFTNQSSLAINVAANSSTQATLTGAASMTNSSDDSCQGATFTVPVTLSGNSNA
jgi:hypothetical protein